MAINDSNNRMSEERNSDASLKPDPETLHTTDPQEHMKGPVSSMMQGLKEDWEDASKDESAGYQDESDRSEEKRE